MALNLKLPLKLPQQNVEFMKLELVTMAGGIVCPAVPSFYGKPSTIEEVAGTVVDRVLDLSGLEWQSFRWGE